DGIPRQRVGQHLQIEGDGGLGDRRARQGMEIVTQRIHLMEVWQVGFGIDIAYQRDVEDLAQVAEGLARAYLATRVGGIHERLGEEEDLETGRGITGGHLDGPPGETRARRVPGT